MSYLRAGRSSSRPPRASAVADGRVRRLVAARGKLLMNETVACFQAVASASVEAPKEGDGIIARDERRAALHRRPPACAARWLGARCRAADRRDAGRRHSGRDCPPGRELGPQELPLLQRVGVRARTRCRSTSRRPSCRRISTRCSISRSTRWSLRAGRRARSRSRWGFCRRRRVLPRQALLILFGDLPPRERRNYVVFAAALGLLAANPRGAARVDDERMAGRGADDAGALADPAACCTAGDRPRHACARRFRVGRRKRFEADRSAVRRRTVCGVARAATGPAAGSARCVRVQARGTRGHAPSPRDSGSTRSTIISAAPSSRTTTRGSARPGGTRGPCSTAASDPNPRSNGCIFRCCFCVVPAGLVATSGFRDWRLPVLYVAAVAAFVAWIIHRGGRLHAAAPGPVSAWSFVAVFWVTSYVVWLAVYAIYRYIIPLELLSGRVAAVLPAPDLHRTRAQSRDCAC